jgi:hypothetical protein
LGDFGTCLALDKFGRPLLTGFTSSFQPVGFSDLLVARLPSSGLLAFAPANGGGSAPAPLQFVPAPMSTKAMVAVVNDVAVPATPGAVAITPSAATIVQLAP